MDRVYHLAAIDLNMGGGVANVVKALALLVDIGRDLRFESRGRHQRKNGHWETSCMYVPQLSSGKKWKNSEPWKLNEPVKTDPKKQKKNNHSPNHL